MVLWGAIVNACAIIAGGFLGVLIPRISDRIRRTVMQGLGLSIAVLGITMAIKPANILLTIFSLVAGGVIGELLRIEDRLQQLGDWLERTVARGSKHNARMGSVAEGFVTATLVFCIGAMAILGSLDSGLRHNHDILYTKAMLDGFLAIIFASTLGIGVVFSAVPILLYEGIISLTAALISSGLGSGDLDAVIAQITAVGGVLIIGIGINILEIKRINVGNLLPAIVIAAVGMPLYHALF